MHSYIDLSIAICIWPLHPGLTRIGGLVHLHTGKIPVGRGGFGSHSHGEDTGGEGRHRSNIGRTSYITLLVADTPSVSLSPP